MKLRKRWFGMISTMNESLRIFFIYVALALLTWLFLGGVSSAIAQTVTAVRALEDPDIDDQDDMCVWIHDDAAQSLIITSDKAAYKLFVYDLSGNTLQVVDVSGKPANIDVRYHFPLNGAAVDIVAYADRDDNDIIIYQVNASQRQLAFLSRFDGGSWPDEIYGFCLYKSPNTGKYYAIASGTSGQMRQWELVADGSGGINGIEVRTWSNHGQTEGLVADDETGMLYAANETDGIYKYEADPVSASPSGEKIIATGENGLIADVEGITIYYAADGQGYLVASNQNSDNFKVYQRQPPHSFVKTFDVSGAGGTDGIDIVNVGCGNLFPNGLFLLHNGGGSSHEVLVCNYADLGLTIDTDYWNPRTGTISALIPAAGVPESFELLQNYPNPFNPSTRIRYRIDLPGQVTLIVFDILGQMVAVLVDAFHIAGEYEIRWNALARRNARLTDGIYFAQLKAGGRVRTIKMTLIQ